MAHVIQTVGNFTSIFSHPLILAAAQITLKGFKLEDTFVSAAQSMDNSKRIPLVDGGTIAITNAVLAGILTINALRVSKTMNIADGDLPLIATTLQGLADSVGGTLTLSYGFLAATESITFHDVTVVSCPPIILAGNDVPVYPVMLGYSHFTRGT